MAKECCIVILDVGESMGRLIDNASQKTGLDYAKDAFRLMVQQKLLFGAKRDEMGLMLLNSKDTMNITHEELGGGYEHIENIWHLQQPSLDLLEKTDSIQIEGGKGDILDSLVVASQLIVERVKHLKFSKRVFILTDAAQPINEQEQIDQIAATFVSNNIALNVIGIGFGEEDDDEDDDGDVDMEKEIRIVGDNPNRTEDQKQNEIIVRSFVKKAGGNVFSCKNAVKMLSELRSKAVQNRPMFTGQLEITPELLVGVKVYSRCREQTLPSLKKESTVGEEEKGVQMDRVYKNKFRQGDDDEEVTEDERVKSFLYGKQRIPFSEADIENMTYRSGLKHFKLLGFVQKSQVKRHHFMGPVLVCVTTDPDYATDSVALSAFVRACHEKDMCGLARLVARKNGNPKFVVLEPRIKSSMECFIMNELPFYEDIRRYPFASFTLNKKFQPTAPQLNAARNLVDSLDLMEAEFDEDGDPVEALRPNDTFNPILQRYYENVQCRALDAEAPIQDLDAMIAKMIEPSADLFNRAGAALQEFQNSFEFKVIPKKEAKKQRKHWADVSDEIDNLLSGLGADGMKREEKIDDDDMDVDLDDMLQVDAVKAIGTQNPIQDFDTLLKKRSHPTLLQELCKEMWKVLSQIVESSFQDKSYPKVIDCIEHVRKVCIMEEEPQEFNKGLREFKQRYEPRKKSLWGLLIDKGLTLISMADFEDEVDGLDVTAQDAGDFLLKEEVQAAPVMDSIDVDSDDEMDELV